MSPRLATEPLREALRDDGAVTRWVLHVDLDQFLAAVELLRRPDLRGRPVVIGGDGDPTKRGVVSTASYEARAFGVHSGLPLRTAAKRCPDAVFLPVDMADFRRQLPRRAHRDGGNERVPSRDHCTGNWGSRH